jgi:hypothetical protein
LQRTSSDAFKLLETRTWGKGLLSLLLGDKPPRPFQLSSESEGERDTLRPSRTEFTTWAFIETLYSEGLERTHGVGRTGSWRISDRFSAAR